MVHYTVIELIIKQNLHRIIETAIREGKIEYYGDGTETREYIHVKDAADLRKH